MIFADYATFTNLKSRKAKSNKWDNVCEIISIGGSPKKSKIQEKGRFLLKNTNALTMEKYSVIISVEFMAGADVPDEAYRFRKIFFASGLTVNEELYAGRTVTFIVECPDSVLDSICCLLDDEKADTNSPVIDFKVMPDDDSSVSIPMLGKVSA